MKKSGKNQSGKIEPDDAALFRAAVGSVTPLEEQNRITSLPPARKPIPRATTPQLALPDNLSDGYFRINSPDSTASDTPNEFLSNGLSRLTLRKLRRQSGSIQDRLDLHGLHSDAARNLLQQFLHGAEQRGLRCVLVIHGKGMNSRGGEAVLRKLSRHWLAQHTNVLGYCEAPPQEGGSGAVLVLLKSSAATMNVD